MGTLGNSSRVKAPLPPSDSALCGPKGLFGKLPMRGTIGNDGAYCVEVKAQGSRRRFLAFAGRTLKEARSHLKEATAPPK